ncbi:energy-coupling factor transport system substrate-specific component [Mobilisporobacter senegalensis]|uniref:Energy-coupling factor transport system substrate-specific component n=1 Tax=Mobilisporobacter senegalensis TaxID=1329262 RepID=A0A3N1XGD7_9FIRM|nr:MptD family putative ECF transporter S component [Mobilisporobacter senegalensis]ROR25725.1 energy-coupling factor transport system substrate-specific component [Mobilisporobacter senegalensis]
MENKKITAKDLINIGIFAAIYFVVLFVVAMIGFFPPFMVALCFICPIATGIPFMLYMTKVHTFGQLTIFGVVMGLANMLIGDQWITLAFAVICGLLADLICLSGKYRSGSLAVLGYAVFSIWTFGKMLPLFIMRDSYFQAMGQGYGKEYAEAVLKLTSNWVFPIILVSGFIGGLIGAFIGRAVLKKHFERAGIA